MKLIIIRPLFYICYLYMISFYRCLTVFLLSLILHACHTASHEEVRTATTAESFTYVPLDPPAFAAKLAELDDEQLVDVRTPAEYGTGHLANAMVIDFRNEKFQEEIEQLDHNKPLMIYCASGGRSRAATTLLTELGFKEVYELQGGLTSWVGEGRAVEK